MVVFIVLSSENVAEGRPARPRGCFPLPPFSLSLSLSLCVSLSISFSLYFLSLSRLFHIRILPVCVPSDHYCYFFVYFPPYLRRPFVIDSHQARIRELVEPMAEARAKIVEDGKARPAGFLTASEIEPLSTAFRKLVGLDEIQGKFKFMKSKKALLKPRVALLDLMRNQFAVSGEFKCCLLCTVIFCFVLFCPFFGRVLWDLLR